MVRIGVISTVSTTTELVDTTTVPESFDEDAELKKIAETCLSNSDFEELTGNSIRSWFAELLASVLIPESAEAIGLMELRSTLNLEPLPPWKPYNYTNPSDWDFASAPSLQAYYDLKEPPSAHRVLDSPSLYEHHVTTAVKYLDKRVPAIRMIFRRRFENVRRSMELVDRKAIDRMIQEFYEVNKRVETAVHEMRDYHIECYELPLRKQEATD
ncbi:unnamed protein product [Caenorhabditis nigoni]